MAVTTGRMKFGMFMAPFHRAGENPTLALQRDLELVEELERLGYDEVTTSRRAARCSASGRGSSPRTPICSASIQLSSGT